MATQYYEGIGRRKESTARVRLMSGSGKFVVNERPAEEYFPRLGDLESILAPLQTASENRDLMDISVLVKGGGVTGQTEAVQLGVARALVKMNPDLKPAMRKGGFLTRDARIKERKKPGPNARARRRLIRNVSSFRGYAREMRMPQCAPGEIEAQGGLRIFR
ncbi:MAG: 30S ribosomal protein S9 [Anaerolineales bacterium]|nr:30S ribosomal protein S9 [Anaerolineales bacterium]